MASNTAVCVDSEDADVIIEQEIIENEKGVKVTTLEPKDDAIEGDASQKKKKKRHRNKRRSKSGGQNREESEQTGVSTSDSCAVHDKVAVGRTKRHSAPQSSGKNALPDGRENFQITVPNSDFRPSSGGVNSSPREYDTRRSRPTRYNDFRNQTPPHGRSGRNNSGSPHNPGNHRYPNDFRNHTPPRGRYHSPRSDRDHPGSPRTPNYQQCDYDGTPGSKQQGSSSKHRNRHHRSSTPRKLTKPFEPYMSTPEVSAGLKKGKLIQGSLRINPRNFEDAYIDNPENKADIYLHGIHARNRALTGDIVAVQLLAKSEWKVKQKEYDNYLTTQDSVSTDMSKLTLNSNNTAISADKGKSTMDSKNMAVDEKDAVGNLEPVVRSLFDNAAQQTQKPKDVLKPADIPDKFLQKTAKVVFIIEKKHSRAATGNLKTLPEKDTQDALFCPIDHRLPRIKVPLAQCPDGFIQRPGDFSNVLFVARITDWPEDSGFATGMLQRSLGEAGQIEPETEGFLIENGVDFSEFSDQALDCLPKNLPWKIPSSEIELRRDLRQECIFTIDPATARDLDDALHCKPLGDGNYEIGVHIADVSYFLQEGTELDSVASFRATSVYLVQKVIPMLPRLLCEQLCSLNPAEDRLTFSVIWKISEEGKILDEWIGRSVISSCVKMTYQHAQGIIEEPDRIWNTDELPDIIPRYNISNIVQGVLNLHKVAMNLRKQRFDDGALRLDQPKLAFTINRESGLPNGCSVYEQKDSNRLVEEFMLLANMAVAHRIYKSFPTKSLLRRHPPPKSKMIDDVVVTCKRMGLHINAATAGDLQSSLKKYYADDDYSKSRSQILVQLCSKPMQMAKYFCTGFIADENDYRHYALNVPFYTHFTSPIRRYADVVVHRLLAQCLDCGPEVKSDKTEIQKQSERCNDRKTASKRVQELSGELFFSVFIKECGPIDEKGMVMAVLDQSVDVLILKFGVIKRVYCNALPLKAHTYDKSMHKPSLTMIWKKTEEHPNETKQVLEIFTPVEVTLKADEQVLKYSAFIKRPECVEL